MKIEPLEPRIAPATLLNPRTAQYTDSDGDLVTVHISKGAFLLSYNLVMTPSGMGEYLDTLKLFGQKEFNKANLTITAEPSELGGDGKVNIGLIAASLPRRFWSVSGIQLGKVIVDGDLAAIHVGKSGDSLALKLLDVGSMGTQDGLSERNSSSNIFGNVATIHIHGNLEDSTISVYRDQFLPKEHQGAIGQLFIDGSIIGGERAFSGSVTFSSKLGKAVVKGDIIGGTGRVSGMISSLGPDDDSPIVGSDGLIKNLEIQGDVIGGSGAWSGHVGAGVIKNLSIARNVVGGAGEQSGLVVAAIYAKDIQIGGSVLGGSANGSGGVLSHGLIKSLTIGGDVVGGDAKGTVLTEAGFLKSRTFRNVMIGGSLIVGEQSGEESLSVGAIRAEDRIGNLSIGGSIAGNESHTAIISAGQSIGKLSVQSDVFSSEILVGYGVSVSSGRFYFWNVPTLAGEEFHYQSPVITLDYRGVVLASGAHLDSFIVGGDFMASSIAVGVLSGTDRVFGTEDDTLMEEAASIASIIIKGQAKGDAVTDTRHFGIVAGNIASLTIGGIASLLSDGHDHLALSDTPASPPGDGFDFHLIEIRNH